MPPKARQARPSRKIAAISCESPSPRRCAAGSRTAQYRCAAYSRASPRSSAAESRETQVVPRQSRARAGNSGPGHPPCTSFRAEPVPPARAQQAHGCRDLRRRSVAESQYESLGGAAADVRGRQGREPQALMLLTDAQMLLYLAARREAPAVAAGPGRRYLISMSMLTSPLSGPVTFRVEVPRSSCWIVSSCVPGGTSEMRKAPDSSLTANQGWSKT